MGARAPQCSADSPIPMPCLVEENVPVFSAALSRAIMRTTTLPMETGVYPRPRGAMRELMRTADVLVARGYRVADPRRTPGETALWLVALGRGQRADGWEGELAWALEHPVPYIREVALERLPAPAAEPFVPAIRRSLEQPDIDVAIAACKIVERDRIRSLRPQLSELLSRAQDTWLINAIGNALFVTGGRFEYLDAIARRMADPSQAVERFHSLITVFDSKGAGGSVTPQEAAATSEGWRAFLAVRRQEIEAGQRIPLDVRLPLDLIPPGWKFTRPDGTSWPPGR